MEINNKLQNNKIKDNSYKTEKDKKTKISFENFFQEKFLSDCLIINKETEKEIYSHKLLLSLHSKYFHEIISENVKFNLTQNQINQNEQKYLKIPLPDRLKTKIYECNFDEQINLILKYIYSNGEFGTVKNDLNEKNIFAIICTSKSLGIERFSNKLTKLILKKFLNKEFCLKIYLISLLLDNISLEKEAFDIILKNFSDLNKKLEDIEIFFEFPYQNIVKLAQQDNIVTETEKEICDLILNYIKYRRNKSNTFNNSTELSTKNIKKESNILDEEKREEEIKVSNIIKNEEKKDSEINKEENDNDKNANVEKEEIPIENVVKEMLIENKINFDDNPSNKILLDWNTKTKESENKLLKMPLTKKEERNLIELIRFSQLSHSDLINLSIDPIMEENKDLILQGLSIRLNSYESNNLIDKLEKSINFLPRLYIIDQKKYLGNFTSNEKNKHNQEKNNNKKLNENFNSKKNNSVEVFNFKNYKISNKKSNNDIETVRYKDDLNNSLKREIDGEYQNDLINYQNYSKNKNFSENKIQKLKNINSQKKSDNFNEKIKLLNKIKQNNIHEPFYEFIYEYDFDENGVFSYLGSLGKTCTYQNPHQINQIKAFCSSIGKGNISELVGRDLVNLRSLNEPNSFFAVDLGEDRFLLPSAYTIRNRNSSSHVLLSWNLIGSSDRKNFEILDTRCFRSKDIELDYQLENERNQLKVKKIILIYLLKMPGCTSTWFIDKDLQLRYPKGFRYFFIKQTDKNSSGSDNLAISGFELYGTGYGYRWKF